MPEADRDQEQPANETAPAKVRRGRRDKPMDEEEKVLAGRADANMPALLTKNVLGG